jgi:tetratricopeptide (TPR) repeat protein
VLGLVACGSVVLVAAHASRPATPTAHVTDVVLAEALAMGVPDRPTMTDEIEHFEQRAAERPRETFAALRLFNAHMLAFRAYGDTMQLAAAERTLGAFASGRAADASTRAARSALHLARHEFGAALAESRVPAGVALTDEDAYRLFDALWAVGSEEEARGLLERPLDTLSTAYLSRAARAHDAEGRVEVAREAFRLIVERVDAYAEPAPVRAWARVELGHFQLHSGDPAAAVRSYRSALDVLPGSPAALEGLASVALGVDRDLHRARLLYEKALENGAHLDLMPVLAGVVEELGDSTGARALRHAFVARATASPELERMYARPLAFVLADDPETRADALRFARQDSAERRDRGAWDALAWVRHRGGDHEMAARFARRATASGTAPPPIAYRAGVIAFETGDRGAARRLLRKALDGAVELSPAEERNARARLEATSGLRWLLRSVAAGAGELWERGAFLSPSIPDDGDRLVAEPEPQRGEADGSRDADGSLDRKGRPGEGDAEASEHRHAADETMHPLPVERLPLQRPG